MPSRFLLPSLGLPLLGVAFACAFLSACGDSSKSSPATNGKGTVSVSISDPATCQAPNGIYSHVYITVTDVLASTSANAGDNDPSFVDLTPGLKPQQIDLLGQANNQCLLATLGSTQQLQAGNYQQIRLILLPDSSAGSVTGNACGSFANCVVLADNSVHDLELSSEAKTGLKIPSGQIASGQFSIAAGQTKDLDINFNTCDSIVEEGNGKFRLKPVLHAGEVQTTSTSINGKVGVVANAPPLTGASVLVALEQKDASGVDRILMTTGIDAGGGFVFCPVPAGTYDLVVVALNGGTGLSYAPSVLTGIQPGQTAGTISLTPSAGANATISGTVTTGAASADLFVSALAGTGTSGPTVTIPTLSPGSQSGAGDSITTSSGTACALNTACATYSLSVPAAFPNVGAYSSTGATFTAAGTGNPPYTIDALAFVPSSGGTPDCTPSELQTSQNAASTPLVVAPATTATAAPLAFTGCK